MGEVRGSGDGIAPISGSAMRIKSEPVQTSLKRNIDSAVQDAKWETTVSEVVSSIKGAPSIAKNIVDYAIFNAEGARQKEVVSHLIRQLKDVVSLDEQSIKKAEDMGCDLREYKEVKRPLESTLSRAESSALEFFQAQQVAKAGQAKKLPSEGIQKKHVIQSVKEKMVEFFKGIPGKIQNIFKRFVSKKEKREAGSVDKTKKEDPQKTVEELVAKVEEEGKKEGKKEGVVSLKILRDLAQINEKLKTLKQDPSKSQYVKNTSAFVRKLAKEKMNGCLEQIEKNQTVTEISENKEQMGKIFEEMENMRAAFSLLKVMWEAAQTEDDKKDVCEKFFKSLSESKEQKYPDYMGELSGQAEKYVNTRDEIGSAQAELQLLMLRDEEKK